ncbi:MAG: thioredoxin domain-containing protein, partial [Stellaceae bacterium]
MTDKNRLGDETSPYLLQHKDNPVHWQPWGEAVLDAAKAADKPILLSIGYAACHWCHVMAHESFEDPAVAARMNRLFINVKVDREERPDLDSIYQHALALMGEQGGWPLTMFLTPDGEPFWGGTYFPPAPRWGRAGFPQLLDAVAEAYAGKREDVAKNVGVLRTALARLAQPERGGAITPDLLDRIAERLLRETDQLYGGIGTAPKFPQCGILELLWRAWKRTRQPPYREAVVKALDAMCQGGIYDHLGGGFARYSTDARWLVPHFEKMLYDNAELVDLLTLVWQETKSPLYRERIEETIGWVGREMLTAGSGFASSLDADSEHEEGKFYVWTEREIDKHLGARAAHFKEIYDATAAGNWEGKIILNRLHHLALQNEAAETALAADRAVLFHARAERERPGCDDKVLADWNGLMIAALAGAGMAFARPDWIALAEDAFDFIRQALSGPDGRLSHAWREGKRAHQAILDDYANLARAALLLHEATDDGDYLAAARGWVEICDRHYRDARGGYFFTADDAEALLVRTKQALDQPNPAGNGTMVEVLARLYYLTGEDLYRAGAEEILAAFAGETQRNLFGLSTLLNGAEFLARALQVVVVGTRETPEAEALLRVVNDA